MNNKADVALIISSVYIAGSFATNNTFGKGFCALLGIIWLVLFFLVSWTKD